MKVKGCIQHRTASYSSEATTIRVLNGLEKNCRSCSKCQIGLSGRASVVDPGNSFVSKGPLVRFHMQLPWWRHAIHVFCLRYLKLITAGKGLEAPRPGCGVVLDPAHCPQSVASPKAGNMEQSQRNIHKHPWTPWETTIVLKFKDRLGMQDDRNSSLGPLLFFLWARHCPCLTQLNWRIHPWTGWPWQIMTMTSRVWPVASFEEALPPRLENVLRQRAPYSLVQQLATSFFSEISLESGLSLWRILENTQRITKERTALCFIILWELQPAGAKAHMPSTRHLSFWR